MTTARNGGKPWSAEADQELRRSWEAGTASARICAQFGRTEKSIASRLVVIGLFPDFDQALEALRARGIAE